MIKRVVFSIWLIGAILVFFSSFANQILIDSTIQRQISYAFPEGWGFFTKNPRDLLMEVYKKMENGEFKKIDVSNHSFSNAFGLSRKVRMIGYEASVISSGITQKNWVQNNSNLLQDHIHDSIKVIKSTIKNTYLTEGEYIFKVFRPVPFVWANQNQEAFNPTKFVRIKLLDYDTSN
ncbi:SdpA family antimicrobial peptide system protein [Aquimarina sp. U1-2]|uniref:SdpA family antimicrobial peptide system protein n=1 Tax=Aquimarina sp. U1-2 TaxID=2823141 RepID=UPI001AECCBAA|nr:SdpA family antimicrobial peptide system protein [Aquimarina sp. U1-2]MBP2834092.1 SdpA family antimicrobial peptide system protein [Aquimarina sp. U1-2]